MTSAITVRAARRGGWYKGADVDEVAVLRAVRGDHLRLTTAEREAAIDELDRAGLSAAEVADRIGCSERTVMRRRVQRIADGGPEPAIYRRLYRGHLWGRIAELNAAGVPVARIAAQLGVARSTVYNHRRRNVQQVAA